MSQAAKQTYQPTALEQTIIDLWNSGVSSPEIQKATKLTRGALQGTIYKLRRNKVPMQSRKPEGNHVPYERKAPVPKVVASKPLPAYAAKPVTDQPGVPFHQSRGCMWPLWGADACTGHVCGEELLILNPGTRREKPSSYCAAHHQRAYPAYGQPKKND